MFHDVIAMIGTNPAVMLVKEHILDTTKYVFFSKYIFFFEFYKLLNWSCCIYVYQEGFERKAEEFFCFVFWWKVVKLGMFDSKCHKYKIKLLNGV